MEQTNVFQTDVKQVFDFIRCSEDKDALLQLVKNDDYYQHMEPDAFNVITQYTNSKNLVNLTTKTYETEGGKRNVCKAIEDLIADSRAEGRELGISQGENAERLRVIQKKLEKGWTLEEIADTLELPLKEIRKLAECLAVGGSI